MQMYGGAQFGSLIDYRAGCAKFTSGKKSPPGRRVKSSTEKERDGALASGLRHLVQRTWLSFTTHRKSPSLKEATCLSSSMAITMLWSAALAVAEASKA